MYDRFDSLGWPNGRLQALWSKAFGLEGGQDDALTDVLQAFRDQVDEATGLLKERGVPEPLWRPQLDRLKHTGTLEVLHADVNSWKASITTPDFRLVIAWISWELRVYEEPPVSDEQQQELLKHIAALEAALNRSSVPRRVRAIFEKNIGTLREALRLYPISGVRVLNEALSAAVGDVHVNRASMEAAARGAPENVQAVAELSATLKAVGAIADVVNQEDSKWEAAGQIASAVSPHIELALGFFDRLLEGPEGGSIDGTGRR